MRNEKAKKEPSPKLWRLLKVLPEGTFPMELCHPDAKDAARTPFAVNPQQCRKMRGQHKTQLQHMEHMEHMMLMQNVQPLIAITATMTATMTARTA